MTGAFLKHEREQATKVVLLSGRDIEDAARLIRLLVEGSEVVEVVRMPSPGRPLALTRDVLIDAARRELQIRRRRTQLLSEGMFGEPAWEMLLLLYVEQQGTRLTIARLSSNLSLPPTTALRWLSYLQDKRLVQREPHPTDQRSAFVQLTTKAIEALDMYFSEAIARRA